jgi:hypothetical protein
MSRVRGKVMATARTIMGEKGSSANRNADCLTSPIAEKKLVEETAISAAISPTGMKTS